MVEFFTAEQLVENYNEFRKLINDSFSGERLDSLNRMYDHFEDRIIYTPASSFEHFHNAFPGGYIDHVMRVVRNALKMHTVYNELGIGMGDYDEENVIFAALHHDLGKLGNVDNDYYIKNDSEWHVKNQGKIYKTNGAIHWMNLTHRTFYLLSYFGVKLNEVEWLGIQLTDGLYDENNKEYFIKFSKEDSLKTSLPFVMHSADLAAARFENERWLNGMKPVKSTRNSSPGRKSTKKDLSSIVKNNNSLNIDFDNIFGDSGDTE